MKKILIKFFTIECYCVLKYLVIMVMMEIVQTLDGADTGQNEVLIQNYELMKMC